MTYEEIISGLIMRAEQQAMTCPERRDGTEGVDEIHARLLDALEQARQAAVEFELELRAFGLPTNLPFVGSPDGR